MSTYSMRSMSTLCCLGVVFVVSASGAAQDANLARLDRYVGSWGGYSSKTTSISGLVNLTSAWVDLVAKKAAPNAIELQGKPWDVKAALRFDKASGKYLLGWSAEGFPPVADLPVQFSEGGFTGIATLTCNGKECQAEATIKETDGGGSEWTLVVNQSKDRWSLRLRLGKGK